MFHVKPSLKRLGFFVAFAQIKKQKFGKNAVEYMIRKYYNRLIKFN